MRGRSTTTRWIIGNICRRSSIGGDTTRTEVCLSFHLHSYFIHGEGLLCSGAGPVENQDSRKSGHRLSGCKLLELTFRSATRPRSSWGRRNWKLQVGTNSFPCIWPLNTVSRFPETEKISPPLLQMSEVTFGYTPEKIILNHVNIDVGLDSRIAIVGANGAGKSTL